MARMQVRGRILGAILLLLIAARSQAQEVQFLDPNLERAVRYQLGIPPPTPITQTEMLQLTELGGAWGIARLEGIEYGLNLEVLALGGNPLEDLSPLLGLPRLRHLSFGGAGHSITDLSVVGQLTSLRSVGIGESPALSDLTPLSGLVNLEGLWVQRTAVEDISMLAGLTNTVHVVLQENRIRDVSSLWGLSKLREAHLDDNEIAHVSGVTSLPDLSFLTLSGNRLQDVGPLSNLTAVLILELPGNLIADISPLAGMDSVKNMILRDNQITDIRPLIEMDTLIGVDLRGNPLNLEAYQVYIPMLEADMVFVQCDPIPEPGALTLAGLGAAAVLLRRRPL